MTYFDATLDAAPITEQQNEPVLPEERHVFELIGFERSQPDQWRKDGGIKWTWRVFKEDGRTPFVFQDEQYQFFRTTGIDKQGKPVFSVGTYANDWASAMLGRPLGVDANFSVSELRGKRMSAMVVWENQKSDPKKKTIKLASLRHVFPEGSNGTAQTAAPPARSAETVRSVSADASDEDVDRALIVSKIQRSLKTLKQLDADAYAQAKGAVDASDFDEALLDDLTILSGQISDAVKVAIDG